MFDRHVSTFVRGGLLALVVAAIAGGAAAQDGTGRISNNSVGQAGNGESLPACISADGHVVAFTSLATDLVSGDNNGKYDVFVFDPLLAAPNHLERVSVADDESEGNGDSLDAALSADGRFLAFRSYATNLVGISVPEQMVYVRDRLLGTTTLVSVADAGTPANGDCGQPAISADGTRVCFDTWASNLVANDGNGQGDVFVRDLAAGTTLLASVLSDGTTQGNGASMVGHLSGDGRHVLFRGYATNFPGNPGDGDPKTFDNAVFVKDLDDGTLERVDVDSAEVAGAWGDGSVMGISDDGQLLLFMTGNALVPEDDNVAFDLYLRDRTSGSTERVSLLTGGAQITYGAIDGKMSGDGRYVAWLDPFEDHVAGDDNGLPDVVVRDRVTGITSLVSRGVNDEDNDDSLIWTGSFSEMPNTCISADGTAIVFVAATTAFQGNDTNGTFDVFVRGLDKHVAGSSHYDVGWPGTGGTIPTIDPVGRPLRGGPLDLAVTNSSGVATVGLLLVGQYRDHVDVPRGGALLVWQPLFLPFPLPAAGLTIAATVPTDFWTNGLTVCLQMLELDTGAAGRISMTDGLELVLGDL